MTTKSINENAWAEDMGRFLYHVDPDTRKITRSLEKIELKIINSVISSLTKLTWIITCCLNIHSSIYMFLSILLELFYTSPKVLKVNPISKTGCLCPAIF